MNNFIQMLVIGFVGFVIVMIFVCALSIANMIVDNMNGASQIDWQLGRAKQNDMHTIEKAQQIAQIGKINAETQTERATARSIEASAMIFPMLAILFVFVIIVGMMLATPRVPWK